MYSIFGKVDRYALCIAEIFPFNIMYNNRLNKFPAMSEFLEQSVFKASSLSLISKRETGWVSFEVNIKMVQVDITWLVKVSAQ